VVLAEMLCGGPMYTGETVSETLAAVIMKDPDLARLPPTVPANVRRLLRRCLDKDPHRRLRDIGEARVVLEEPNLWIVFHTAPWLLKKLWLLVDRSDSQALMSALPHEHRLQLAALYTLQHGLTRNTQFRRGYDHGHIFWWRLLHDARPQLIINANLPWCEKEARRSP
jgi:hypothetical protein